MNELLTHNDKILTVGGFGLRLFPDKFIASGGWYSDAKSQTSRTVHCPLSAGTFSGYRTSDAMQLRKVEGMTPGAVSDYYTYSSFNFMPDLHIKNFEITTSATPHFWHYDRYYSDYDEVTGTAKFHYNLGGSSAPASQNIAGGSSGTYRYTAADLYTPSVNSAYGNTCIGIYASIVDGTSRVTWNATWTASGVIVK